MLDGVLPIDKPSDWTSHDVVAKVRGMLQQRRIGHTGTLDPMATGCLPLCLGKATRIAEWLQDSPKTYIAEVIFGIQTDSEDVTGIVLEQIEGVKVKQEEVEMVMNRLKGPQLQTPPMVSAVKIKGKKLYEYARKGMEIDRPARPIEIYEISALDWNLDDDYPKMTFKVHCSKGTYIRTLCSNLGRELGFPAVMGTLRRVKSGGISIKQCLSLDRVDAYLTAGTLKNYILPMDQSLQYFPKRIVDDSVLDKACNGVPIEIDNVKPFGADDHDCLFRMYSEEGSFIGIYRYELGMYRVVKLLNDVTPNLGGNHGTD